MDFLKSFHFVLKIFGIGLIIAKKENGLNCMAKSYFFISELVKSGNIVKILLNIYGQAAPTIHQRTLLPLALI